MTTSVYCLTIRGFHRRFTSNDVWHSIDWPTAEARGEMWRESSKSTMANAFWRAVSLTVAGRACGQLYRRVKLCHRSLNYPRELVPTCWCCCIETADLQKAKEKIWIAQWMSRHSQLWFMREPFYPSEYCVYRHSHCSVNWVISITESKVCRSLWRRKHFQGNAAHRFAYDPNTTQNTLFIKTFALESWSVRERLYVRHRSSGKKQFRFYDDIFYRVR